jgi:hypothetical protein
MKILLSLLGLYGLFFACHRTVEASSASRVEPAPVLQPVPVQAEDSATEDAARAPAPVPQPFFQRRARCGEDVIL